MTSTDKLGTFDGRDVITTSVAITNAGDGLSQALGIDPQIMHIGDTGVVVLEYTVTKIGFIEVKDTDVLNRVHTLRAGTAAIIDRELVAEALDAQALKIERAKGVERLPLNDSPDDEGD
jgi:hypothetical protein